MEQIYNIKKNDRVILTKNYLKKNGYTNKNGFSFEIEKTKIYTIIDIDDILGVQIEDMDDIDTNPFYVPFGAYKVLK